MIKSQCLSNNSFKIRLIDALGLRSYLVSKLVFRPPSRGYIILEEYDQLGNKKLVFYITIKNRTLAIRNPNIDIQTFVITSKSSYCPVIYITGSQVCHNSLFQTSNFMNRLQKHSTSCDNIEQVLDPSEQESAFIRVVSIEERTISMANDNEPNKFKSNIQRRQLPQLNKNFSQATELQPNSSYMVRKNKLLIIFSHGNASDLGDIYYFAEKMVQLYDVDFIAYDYTGYGIGRNTYQVKEEQTYEDLQNIVVFAVRELGYKLSQIVLWGFSLGSGPTIEIASRFAGVAGVVLQAPFASITMWADASKQNVRSCEKDVFSNINKISSIKSSILFIHGNRDSIVNIRHSRILYQKVLENSCSINNQSIWFIEVCGADHNDLQDFITKEDCDLNAKISKFLSDVDSHRELLEMNYFPKEWPLEQVGKIRLVQECLARETTLINLLYDDIKVQSDSIEKQFNEKKKVASNEYFAKSLIVPLEELVLVEDQCDSYPDLFRTMNSSTHKSIKSVNDLQNKKKDKKKKFFMDCVCGNDFQE